jgi:hypothetical protein
VVRARFAEASQQFCHLEAQTIKPAPRPKKFIAIRTECAASTTASMLGFEGERWASAGQALVFGCAVIGRTADWRIDREVIFYPDDLPESGVVALRDYVQELTWRLGARPRKEGDPEPDLIWRDKARLGTPVNGRSVKVQLLPLSESSSSIASPTKIVRSSLATIFPASSRASLRTGARLKRARRSAGGSSLSGPTWTRAPASSGQAQVGGPSLSSSGSHQTSPLSNSRVDARRAIEGSSLTYRTWRMP